MVAFIPFPEMNTRWGFMFVNRRFQESRTTSLLRLRLVLKLSHRRVLGASRRVFVRETLLGPSLTEGEAGRGGVWVPRKMRVRAGWWHGQPCSLRLTLGACWHGGHATSSAFSPEAGSEPRPHQWDLQGRLHWQAVASSGVSRRAPRAPPWPEHGARCGLASAALRVRSVCSSPQVLEARRNHPSQLQHVPLLGERSC